jgi:hypothetical protein
LVSFYGGSVASRIEDASHVVCLDVTNVKNYSALTENKLHHFVTLKWLEDCIGFKSMIEEKNYSE